MSRLGLSTFVVKLFGQQSRDALASAYRYPLRTECHPDFATNFRAFLRATSPRRARYEHMRGHACLEEATTKCRLMTLRRISPACRSRSRDLE